MVMPLSWEKHIHYFLKIEIKKLVIDHGVITRHCFIEANKVAEKLASISHNIDVIKVYTQYIDLPTTIRGLLTTDRWQFPSFRVKMRKL
ncbi:hypothetical protein H5410_005766, partial [Solanum commersonii]